VIVKNLKLLFINAVQYLLYCTELEFLKSLWGLGTEEA
jgi:hypothetical protein